MVLVCSRFEGTNLEFTDIVGGIANDEANVEMTESCQPLIRVAIAPAITVRKARVENAIQNEPVTLVVRARAFLAFLVVVENRCRVEGDIKDASGSAGSSGHAADSIVDSM